jgi:tetraacyldisaccharide 4'-kinase
MWAIMRAKLETWLNKIWYEQQPVPVALRALSMLYARFLPTLKPATPEQFNLPPIIVVGNLTIGGSGKTPFVIWLVQRAQAAGLKVGVISRGYGGSNAKTKNALAVELDTDWRVCGDEALLIKRRTGVPVAVARERVQAARLIHVGLDLIISDDGLQNPKIPRTLEVLVIDGVRRFGNEKLLPAGPLRVLPPANLPQRFPFRICHGGKAMDGEYAMRLEGEMALRTVDGTSKPLHEFDHVYALAGIGNPERFYSKLRSNIAQVTPVRIGDHQVLANEQLQKLLCQMPVLCTEKDALKYAPHANLWVLGVDAHLDAHLWDAIVGRVFRSVL